jgi:uncharacterized protein YhfF
LSASLTDFAVVKEFEESLWVDDEPDLNAPNLVQQLIMGSDDGTARSNTNDAALASGPASEGSKVTLVDGTDDCNNSNNIVVDGTDNSNNSNDAAVNNTNADQTAAAANETPL